MPDISEIASVSISSTPSGVTRQGFGLPMILSAHYKWPERARSYSSVASMTSADFDANDPEVLMATALFSQTRKPSGVVIGRQLVDTIGSTVSSTLPTPSLISTITVLTVVVGGTYKCKIGGTTYSTVATAGQTLAQLATAWAAAIDADANHTAAAVGAVITITKTSVGAFGFVAWVETDAFPPRSDAFSVGGTATYSLTFDGRYSMFDDPTHAGDTSVTAWTGLAPVATAFAITAASTVTDKFTIAGDHVLSFYLGRAFTVTGSTGNDASYVVTSVALNAGNTEIGVAVVASAVADGNINLTENETEVAIRFRDIATTNSEISVPFTFVILTGGAYKVTLATVSPARDYMKLTVDARQTITTGTFGRGTLESPGYGFAVAESTVTALAAVQAENADWFWTLLLESDPIEIEDVAKNYVETRIRYMFACTDQSSIVNTTATADTTSVAAILKAASIARTRVVVHPRPDEFPDAGIVGDIAPLVPGAYDTVFRTLVGATPNSYTDTQRSNALDKGVMLYSDFAGTGNTEEGKREDRKVVEFTDVVVGNLYVDVNLEADIFDLLRELAAAGKKVPYTDQGIGLVENVIRARLRTSEEQGIYVVGASTVTVPKRSATTTAQRQARRLTSVTFTAQLQGAIRFVDVVGTVSV